MIKRTIFAACVAAFAFAALPALAAAESVTSNPGDPYLEGVTEGTQFTLAGGEAKLTGATGTTKCKKNSAEGAFEDVETGSIKLVFEECTSPIGTACTTTGSPSGKITTTTLPFHLKTVAHKKPGSETTEHLPGILITPGANNAHGPHLATFECPFVGKIEVGGNGLVGTMTKPKEEEASNTATISFGASSVGSTTQTHLFVTDHARETAKEPPIEYDLKFRLNGSETNTAALDAEGTLTFAGGM